MSFKKLILKDVADYSNERCSIEEISIKNYISTENMLPDKAGITESSGLPNSKTVSKYNTGNILVSNIRPYFKKIWYADKIGGASNDILIFNVDNRIADSKYIYYCLNQDLFFGYMMQTSKGTKMPRGDKSAIMNFDIQLPKIEEQKVIAKILSDLDDKIEVNNKINKRLEEMAQAIFKQWFVDFEFPNEEGKPYKSSGGEMVESELGVIPKGWKVTTISNLCEVGSSKRIYMKEYANNGIPFYRGKEIIEKSKGNIISTELFITEERYNEIKERFGVPSKNDILLTSVGTLGIAYLVEDEDFYFKDGNLTWFKNFNNEIYSYYIYQFLISDEGKKEIDSITIGSTQKALTINALNNIKLAIADSEVLDNFEPIIVSILNSIRRNIKEKNNLIKIRDSLLPKLMSGEIRVNIN